MSAKHTPGPWRYEYEPGYCGELIAPDGMTIAVFVDEPRPYDARLIAAAPDLLAALRRAEVTLRNYEVWRGQADECKRLIAAATGETA